MLALELGSGLQDWSDSTGLVRSRRQREVNGSTGCGDDPSSTGASLHPPRVVHLSRTRARPRNKRQSCALLRNTPPRLTSVPQPYVYDQFLHWGHCDFDPLEGVTPYPTAEPVMAPAPHVAQ